jgi:hypothetical protein
MRDTETGLSAETLIQSLGIRPALLTSVLTMPSTSKAVQPILKSRMLPRISLGFLFVLTTLGALLAAIARAADQGIALAIAAIAALGFVAACFVTFALLFFICRTVAYLNGNSVTDATTGSPFSEGQLPPQILPPREPRP